jgi:hypothetical protein
MANPGRDIHNIQADDMLSPRRQKEIAGVVEVLKRFRPTKVAAALCRLVERQGSPRAEVETPLATYFANQRTIPRDTWMVD